MLKALFAACGLLLGTLLVLAAGGGFVWLCIAALGPVKGAVAAVVILALALGG